MFTQFKQAVKKYQKDNKIFNSIENEGLRMQLFNNRISFYDKVIKTLADVKDELDQLQNGPELITLAGRDIVVNGDIVAGYSFFYRRNDQIDFSVILKDDIRYMGYVSTNEIPFCTKNHKIMFTVKKLSDKECDALDWMAAHFDEIFEKVDADLAKCINAESEKRLRSCDQLQDKIMLYKGKDVS